MLFPGKKKLKPLEGYNLWASSYSDEINPIKKLSDGVVANWLQDLRDKTVLDAGCGAGALCKLAKDRGAPKVVGIDFSPAMIEEAKKNCDDIEFKCLDLSKDKIKDQFDFVICALVLGHIQNLDFALINLIDNLSPNGNLLITDFHPYQTMKGAKRTFTEQSSKKKFEVEHHLHLFEEYFKILRNSNSIVEELTEPCWRGEPVIFGMKIRKLKN